jgi:hypothetical protein
VTAPHDAPAADSPQLVLPTAPSALQLPHVWEEVFAGGRVQRLTPTVPTALPVPAPTPLPAPVPFAADDFGCSCHSCLYAREQELERGQEQELWELVQEREQILVCMRRLLRAVEKADVWELLHDSSPTRRG